MLLWGYPRARRNFEHRVSATDCESTQVVTVLPLTSRVNANNHPRAGIACQRPSHRSVDQVAREASAFVCRDVLAKHMNLPVAGVFAQLEPPLFDLGMRR